MASIHHSAPADGTFTTAGASAWNDGHTLSGIAAQTDLDVVSAALAALSAQHTSLAGSVGGALSAIVANSAQMTSADNAISAAVDALSVVVSNRTSAIVANSVQMTSADNAISAAVAAVSAQHTSLAGSVAGALSAIAANSAQMTSADNAISAAVVALSAQHTSLAASVAGALSAIVANSAQMTSADNAVSAAVVALSAQHTSLAASVAGALSAIADNSAQMTSADNAISAAEASLAAVVSGWATSGNAAALPVKRVLGGNQLLVGSAIVSISGFTFTVSADASYDFQFMIFTSSPISLATPQFMLSAPATSRFMAEGIMGGGVGNPTTVMVSQGNRWTGMVTTSAVGLARPTRIMGGFRASAAGTFCLQIGNAISGAAAGSQVTVIAGSYGYMWRMG